MASAKPKFLWFELFSALVVALAVWFGWYTLTVPPSETAERWVHIQK